MKTAIINLEPHDDILSVLDRLTWVKAPRALLLWPAEGCGLEQRLDFVLLARRARRLNLRVALVARDRRVRELAEDVGLAAFATREEALRRPWLRRRRRRGRRPTPPRDLVALRQAIQALRPTWSRRPGVRAVAFTAAVLAVLALVAFTLPGATVVLTPQPTWQEVTLTVTAAPDYETVSLDGRVPARWIEVTVSGEASRPCSGHTQVPYRPAQVTLRFTNLTDQPVEVPQGTQVASVSDPTYRFATLRAGTVPPLESLEIAAEALQAGAEGNRPADDLRLLDPPLGLQVTVTNPEAAHGGEDLTVPSPTLADMRALRHDLQRQLAEEAEEQLKAQANQKGLWLLPSSLTLQEVLEARYSAEADAPAATLTLTLRIRFGALAVREEDLDTLAHQVLDARLTSEQIPLADTLQWRALRSPQIKKGEPQTYEWPMQVRRQTIPRVSLEEVTLHLAGQPPERARAWLETHLALAAQPKIVLFPRWWPRLPWFASRIQLQVKTPSEP